MTRRRKPVGVIGTGLMGTACAGRLMGAGYEVLGYDIDAKKLAQFKGAGVARSPGEIAGGCDEVLLAVFDTAQVEDVIEGKAGLLAARPVGAPPLLAVCVSTCDPDRIAALAARLPGERLRFVESPISGTSEQVGRGTGLGLIGGDRAAVDAAHRVLDAICPRRHYIGAAGAGARAKLAINLILGVNRAALAEGLVFAERLGLDPGAFLAVARDSAAYSKIMDIKGAKMLAGDFKPHGKITQTLKDFLLMLEQAEKLGQRLPLAEIYAQLVKGCVAAGEGDWDNAAVIEEIRRRRA